MKADEVTEEATRRATEARDNIQAKEPEEPLIQFFAYEHLPPRLQQVSQPFGELARALVGTGGVGVQRCAERTVALRKLLEAKDCAVRAVLYKHPLSLQGQVLPLSDKPGA